MSFRLRLLGLCIIAIAFGLWACSSVIAPCEAQPETCNGKDDDCNNVIDDNLTDLSTDPCGTMEGACTQGVEACVDGVLVCEGGVEPIDEACNQIDDDCDGATDEELSACACTDGGTPGPETCNQIDDDCNAQIDDMPGCACTGGSAPQTEVCNQIDDDCDEMMDEDLTACACTNGGSPSTEVCNQIDDDCDAQVDDGLPTCGCANGSPPSLEVCNQIDDDCNEDIDDGLLGCACTNGGVPSAEVCNQIDDDCNEQVDEGLTDCACTNGGSPTAEVCNRMDDDCDEQVDEDLTDCQCTGGNPPGVEVCDGVDNDCNTLVDEDDGSGGGCGQTGDPCTIASNCSSQICIGDSFFRYCSQECDSLGVDDCPVDFHCFVGSNLDYCSMEFTACESNADCAADSMVCTIQNAEDMSGKVTECRPPLDPGVVPGAECRPDVCANDICNWFGQCSEVCSAASPCVDQYDGYDAACILQGFRVDPSSCSRDEQCPSGRGYTCIDNLCQSVGCVDNTGCDADQTCLTSGDPAPMTCSPKAFFDYVGTCAIACDGDSDCPTDLVCQVAVSTTETDVQGKCTPEYTGNPTGGDCSDESMGCTHGICFNRDYCTQLCGDAADDCPAGWSCNDGTLNMGGAYTNLAARTCVQ